MVSYREENERKRTPELANALQQGQALALVSDAGYPGISDPGFRLVRECRSGGIRVVPVPGPNAAITRAGRFGLPTHQFLFLGFLPKKSAGARKSLDHWREFEGSIVLYESRYRIEKTLALVEETLGPQRFLCLARGIDQAARKLSRGYGFRSKRAKRGRQFQGEFTLVIGPQGYVL